MSASIESREFVQMRNDLYRQAAIGVERPERDECAELEADSGTKGKCVCCGEWKRIRPAMHVCGACFEEGV